MNPDGAAGVVHGESRPVAAGIVLASGSGTRVGSEVNKVYLPLGGRPLAAWSLDALSSSPEVGVLVFVIRPRDRAHAESVLAGITRTDVDIVYGGGTRQESELLALRHLAAHIHAGHIDTVLIHDAARPLVSPTLVAAILSAARAYGAAIPGLLRDDLVVVNSDGTKVVDMSPGELAAVQTPQGFHAQRLLAAYEKAAATGFVGTDTAACVQRFSDLSVRCIEGEPANFKITYSTDLPLAERVVARRLGRS